jgi:hypothetical protein
LSAAGISVQRAESAETLQEQADGLKVVLATEELTDAERERWLSELDDINERVARYLPPDPDHDPLERLRNGPRYPFTVSPRQYIGKDVRSGVYTIWRGEELVYAGFAGRDGAKGGFVNRLVHHKRGDRSGDKFCVYVFDRYVLPQLTASQIRDAAAGRLKLDPLIREFIADQLEYRYVPCENQSEALALEARVIGGELGYRPLLNSITGDDGSPDEAD